MKPIKIAAAVLNQTPLDWDGNLQRTLDAMDQARREDVRLLCLPELCISGYGCEDSFFCSTVQQISQTLLMEIAEKSQGLVVAVGLPLWHGGNLYNMAALIADGKLAGLVGKQNLAREGIHYETRWFSPWPAGLVSHTQISEVDYPIGDLVFEVGGIRIGFEICRDAWVAQRPGSSLAREAVDLILNPSASHFAFGKHATRQRFVLEGSRAFHVGYIYTNLLGNEAGRAIYDGDTMIASCGKLLAKGDRFSFGDSRMVSAVLDIEEARMLRAQWSDAAPSDHKSDRVVQVPFVFEPTSVELTQPCEADWETGESLRLEEFTRAVALGLFDYLRKSHSKGFVVSLSGGADSTATSLLCRIAIELAMADLGADGLHERLKHIDGIKECQTASQFAKRLITCVYQAAENSSIKTRDAAQCVADEIGARFLEFDISGVVDQYLNIATESLRRGAVHVEPGWCKPVQEIRGEAFGTERDIRSLLLEFADPPNKIPRRKVVRRKSIETNQCCARLCSQLEFCKCRLPLLWTANIKWRRWQRVKGRRVQHRMPPPQPPLQSRSSLDS